MKQKSLFSTLLSCLLLSSSFAQEIIFPGLKVDFTTAELKALFKINIPD